MVMVDEHVGQSNVNVTTRMSRFASMEKLHHNNQLVRGRIEGF